MPVRGENVRLCRLPKGAERLTESRAPTTTWMLSRDKPETLLRMKAIIEWRVGGGVGERAVRHDMRAIAKVFESTDSTAKHGTRTHVVREE